MKLPSKRIEVNGLITDLAAPTSLKRGYSVDWLRNAIGGGYFTITALNGQCIEPLLTELGTYDDYFIVVDEDGLDKQLPNNPIATVVAGTRIVGIALIIPRAYLQ